MDIGPWNPHVTCHQGSLAAVASNTPPANSTRTSRPPPMAELSSSLGNCGKRHGNKGYYGWVVWGAKCRKDRNGCFTTFLDLILGCWKWDVQEICSCQNENLLSWLVKTMWNIGVVVSWLKQQATIVDWKNVENTWVPHALDIVQKLTDGINTWGKKADTSKRFWDIVLSIAGCH